MGCPGSVKWTVTLVEGVPFHSPWSCGIGRGVRGLLRVCGAPLAGGRAQRGGGKPGKPANLHRTMSPRSLVTLTLTSEGVAEKAALLPAFLSRQCLQQCFGVLEVGGVKALGEPVVYRGQQVISFFALALLLPQATQAGRRS